MTRGGGGGRKNGGNTVTILKNTFGRLVCPSVRHSPSLPFLSYTYIPSSHSSPLYSTPLCCYPTLTHPLSRSEPSLPPLLNIYCPPSLSSSLSHPLTHSLSHPHSLSSSLSHPLTHSLPLILPLTPTHSLTHSLPPPSPYRQVASYLSQS